MIRTKAKSLFLSIMLLMACCVFFACKEKAKINVESISFTEQSISLLVGEEYTPEVKVLPSYATNRSYTLISSDTTALKIEGGTIEALKPALDVKLKVVSDENQNINDVISVNIYSEATDLSVPTELKFDGDKFTFVGKDNVESYVLKVNGQEINIGNNTEYSFANVESKISGLHNKVVDCSVKAVGDGKIFRDSQFSEEISFVKLSGVNEAYVENEILYFNAIENVASYKLEILSKGQKVEEREINNSSFATGQLSLDLSDLTDSNNGAEYELRIIAKVEGFNVDEGITVYPGNYTSVNYAIIGCVKNVNINDSIISWDFVKNAKTYTVEVYYNDLLLDAYENVATNYLKVEYDETGDYYCRVLANSQESNTTTGKMYSANLDFEVLEIPVIVSANNVVSWNNIENAEGYLVTIKNNLGNIIVNKDFVVGNSYDVSVFGAGIYHIEVVACGNGQQVLSSKTSQSVRWATLYSVEVIVKNEVLRWRDLDANSLHKYRVKFDSVDIVLTENDYSEQYKCNANETEFSYDLSTHDFAPGKYDVTVQNIGESDVFDSEIDGEEIIKLQEASNPTLSNKVFTVPSVAYAKRYEIKIYNAGNLESSIKTLNADGTAFTLDDSDLLAGNYVAKVFVFGDGEKVFDADNENNGTIPFEKLATPTIYVDKVNLKLIVDKDNEITNAEGCKIFEKSEATNKTTERNMKMNEEEKRYEYDLNLSAGGYEYLAQAVGNKTTILDSAVMLDADKIKVKKLANPSMKFDKEELTFTISCSDDDKAYVKDYTFTLNELNETVYPDVNNVVDCKAQITTAGTYNPTVKANTYDTNFDYDTNSGYHLVINSNVQTEIVDKDLNVYSNVSKLSGECDFAISNGVLIVTPKQTLSGSGYSLSFRIDNGEKDIVLDDFNYTDSRFEIKLYDSKYNVLKELNAIMSSAGEYEVYTTISQNKANVVTSESEKVDDDEKVDDENNAIKLSVLGKVTSIAKDEQTIEFGNVDNATNYIAVVTVNRTEYYLDLASKYSKATNNVLTIEDLISLMSIKGLDYSKNTEHEFSIKFVSVSEDNHTIANKGDSVFTFKFLKAPALSVVEKENSNIKYLAIANDDINSVNYSLAINQDMVSIETPISKDNGDNSLVNMDEFDKLNAGNVLISVIANSGAGNYFNSPISQLNVVKLGAPSILVENGLLKWEAVNNAKQYNLTYANELQSGTENLVQDSANFTKQGKYWVYEFDGLKSALTKMYLQVDSQVKVGNTYYLNSNDGETLADIYKLTTLPISVVNGKIYTEITLRDYASTGKVEIFVNEIEKQIDIAQASDDVVVEMTANKLCITIEPSVLFEYGDNELLLETLSLKLYSNNATTLNSSTSIKEVYGLLQPTGLDITTSHQPVKDKEGVIKDVFEKITWNNPEANLEHVLKYEIIVNYNDADYKFYSETTTFMMPAFGESDEGEVEFGAGVYKIKVKALTDNNNNIVNSKYCDEITVRVLETPTNLSAQNGNVIWSADGSVEYYLIRVYLLKDVDGKNQGIIMSTRSHKSEIDLTALTPFETGVYGVSVQAMHDNSRILSSDESEIFEVIRLPQVTNYFVKDGELYIRVHCFYTMAEITLTKGETKHEFTIQNDDLTAYENYIKASFTSWSNSDVLKTFTDKDFYKDVKYQLEGDSTLREAGVENYGVSVKLVGNTAIVGAIVSGHTNANPSNTNFETKTNEVEKLITPTVKISETVRGQVLVGVPKSLNYSLKYYVNGNNALQGVHLYEVTISMDSEYTLYVAQIVDNDLFTKSLNAAVAVNAGANSVLITDGKDRNYLKHFKYNNISFNVIDEVDGYIPFNFNAKTYAYYEPKNGENAGDYVVRSLDNGGSFVVNVRFKGDDSLFVNSNLTNDVKVERYKKLSIAVENGQISWESLDADGHYPIYLVTLTNGSETYNLVLYNPEIYTDTENQIKPYLESGKKYIFDAITGQSTKVVDGKNVIYNNYNNLANKIHEERAKSSNTSIVALKGKGGTFNASVKAHYANSLAMDRVLAQDTPTSTITILPKADILVDNGELKWTLSTISSSDTIFKYQLQVFDVYQFELYTLTLESGNYVTKDGVAIYQLPKTLNNGEDSGFDFVPDTNYIFKLTALGEDGKAYVDSITTETNKIKLLPDLEAKMENGVLTWTNSTTSSVEVCIEYTSGDSDVVINITETGNSFALPQFNNDSNDTLRHLISGQDYKIKVRLKGGNTTLNGFFSDVVTTQRLKTVDKDTIVTEGGKLTWEANTDVTDVKYTVVYTLEDDQTYTSEMLDTNLFDFAGVASGVIKVKVFAHHDKYFTSFASNTDENGYVLKEENGDEQLVTLYKLGVSSKIKYEEKTTTISWDKVTVPYGFEYANNYIVSVKQGEKIDTYKCNDTNEWVIKGVVSNLFEIAIQAVGVNEKNIINGEYTEYQKLTLPNSVDVVEYDNELKMFKWKEIEEPQTGDEYYIGYTHSDGLSTSSEEKEVTTYQTIEGVKYYYFKPYEIGIHTNIYVQVKRAGSLASQPTYCKNGAGDEFALNFDLFNSGEGSSDKPYEITTPDHLLNIRYFLNAHYKILNSIELSKSKQGFKGYITNVDQVFTGTINGGGNEIHGMAIEKEKFTSGYVGLFNKVKGATFESIKLTQFALNGDLGCATLYMGILAGYAEDTTFNDIEVKKSTIQLDHKNVQDIYENDEVDVYIGAIVGYAVGYAVGDDYSCAFTNCVVNLGGTGANIKLDITGNSKTSVNVGGIAGYAKECSFSNNNSSGAFVIQALQAGKVGVNIGALIGCVDSSNGNKIENSKYSYYIGQEAKDNQIGCIEKKLNKD